MSPPITLAELRGVNLFDEIDDVALAEWLAVASVGDTPPGEVLSEQGHHAPGVHLLLAGTARSYMRDSRGNAEPLKRHVAPTWIGAVSVITDEPTQLCIMAETDCRVALIDPDEFRRLALAQPPVHRRVMAAVGPVIGRLTAIEQNRERLASLGTMAAGLAHELNNPAAAAQRTATQLGETLEIVNGALRAFVTKGIERDVAEQLLALHAEALSRSDGHTALDTLDAADAEDELSDRLDELGVAEPWKIAEPLASAGLDRAWLDRVAELAGPATDGALRWVAASLSADGLVAELKESTARMSALVGAVKNYAYLDRGALVDVDLHEGIETTLMILGHKLKHTSIELKRHYDRTLPKLTVRGSELNQVWTNLLDNAIDALGQTGTIEITTRRDGTCAIVEITDDGPGIPPDIGDHVFDSFFTTKDVGQGTGLGLATAQRVVVDRHDGSLRFESKPGQTTFRVSLPFTQS
ncbi:MAG TPA: ATP-binding protein [Solirubrobacteraceae bacterium]